MSTATITRPATTTVHQAHPRPVAPRPRIPLSWRLTRVELRKMANTRSGKWLLIGIGVLTLVVIVAFYASADASERTFFNFMAAANGPQGFLLPVLGILLITSEWSQRTALVSFTLTPVRGRVLRRQVPRRPGRGHGAIAIAVLLASVATVVGGADNAWAHVGVDDLGKLVLLQVTAVAPGAGLRPAVPELLGRDRQLLRPAERAQHRGHAVGRPARGQPWIDLWAAQTPLFRGRRTSPASSGQQIVTSTVIWVVLPLAVGLFRVLRAEVK